MTTLAGPEVLPGSASGTSTITVRPLQPTIGAEIEGVDLAQPLGTAARDEIKAAILRYKVVFFRDQDVDRDQHAAFARQFGPLYVHPSVNKPDADQLPAAHRIAAEDTKKYADLLAQQQAEGWDPYHSDTSWRLVPTWGAVLRAVTLPEVGGDTIWVDAGLAYEGLPAEAKERLEGLHVTHDYRSALLRSGHDYPIVAHPIVRTHRETGPQDPLGELQPAPVDRRTRPRRRAGSSCRSSTTSTASRRYQVRFSWRPGSIAFWDNRAAVHYAVRNFGDFPRLLERILIADEPQYADL